MRCRLCEAGTAEAFRARILGKHEVAYQACPACGFLQTEEPYWLEEAYAEAINLTDTGIMGRNEWLSRSAAVLIYFLFRRDGKYLDYAGGYGVLTRMMRDIGFDFRWHDPYAKNLFARGFEHAGDGPYDLVTSFESFEHFVRPAEELAKLAALSPNILFSTELLPQPMPAPGQWWYYGLEHGQHVSFYTASSLAGLGRRLGLHFCTNGSNLHLFSKRPVDPRLFRLLLKAKSLGLFRFVKSRLRSLTVPDMERLISAAVPETSAPAARPA